MPDMLVRLYDLPDNKELIQSLNDQGFRIIRAIPPSKFKVMEFVKNNFGNEWASECDVAFSNKPVSCIIAANKDKEIVGFACYEATCKAYFGPTGVAEAYRGKQIGKALLISALQGLKEMGYAYGIIGGAGPVDFYKKAVNAFVIPGAETGIYKDFM